MVQDFKLSHKSVMLDEMITLLAPKIGENYLDCTFGAGGYSKAILDYCNCNVIAIDQDPNVQLSVDKIKKYYNNRFRFIETSFAESFNQFNSQKFNGIVMDLGVSSMQLDYGERGFSFMHDGPLDMRMSGTGMSAANFINGADEQDIADVIYQYGNERLSRKIAKSITEERTIERIDSTARLAHIVRNAIGFRKSRIDTATKTFQAIRIYINDELGQLEQFLNNIKNILAPNARLVIVSFHSLEDQIVKNFFKTNSAKIVARSKYAVKPMEEIEPKKWLKILTKKPLYPSNNEIQLNSRSRSARLRAATTIGSEDDSKNI